MGTIERRNRAASEAADWWALLHGGGMTRAERESFIDWLRDSQTNIAEMLRLSQVHGALGQFPDWTDISTEGSDHQAEIIALPQRGKPMPSRHDSEGHGVGRRGMWLAGLAATVAAIALLTMFFLPQWRGQVIATERGERREVTLDDGSVVQVDPQTRLNVQFSKDTRSVRLTQGRALFRVAKNTSRPFLVQAGATTVRAVGTAFGVEQRARDVVVVTVSEGMVAVNSSSIHSNPHPSSLPPAIADGVGSAYVPRGMSARTGEVLLGVNEQITIAAAGAAQPVLTVNSQRELAWAEGRLVFRNDPVAKVIAEFNRYNRLQLYVTDAALAARPVSGVFDAANPEAFLAFIQSAAPVRIERDEGRSIVISPAVSN